MVTLDDAKRIIAAAEKTAAEIGRPMNIAVADADGDLVAHARMDGAWAGCIDISIMKALTSRALELSTQDLAPLFPSASYSELSGPCMHVFNHGRNVMLSGGFPLKRGGKVVGAIGVSGGSGAQDDAVAEAGAAAFA